MAGLPLASSSPERPAKRSRALRGLDLTNPTDCAVHLVKLLSTFFFLLQKKMLPSFIASSVCAPSSLSSRSTLTTTCPSPRLSSARVPKHIKTLSTEGANAGAPRHRRPSTRPNPRDPSISSKRAIRRHSARSAGAIDPSGVWGRTQPIPPARQLAVQRRKRIMKMVGMILLPRLPRTPRPTGRGIMTSVGAKMPVPLGGEWATIHNWIRGRMMKALRCRRAIRNRTESSHGALPPGPAPPAKRKGQRCHWTPHRRHKMPR